MFNIGDLFTHPLCFSLDVDKYNMHLNKEYLFLYKKKRIEEDDTVVGFQRTDKPVVQENQAKRFKPADYKLEEMLHKSVFKKSRDTYKQGTMFMLDDPSRRKRETNINDTSELLYRPNGKDPILVPTLVRVKELSDKNRLEMNSSKILSKYNNNTNTSYNDVRTEKRDKDLLRNENKRVINDNRERKLLKNEDKSVLNDNRERRLYRNVDVQAFLTDKFILDGMLTNQFVDTKNPNIFKEEDVIARTRTKDLENDSTHKLLDTHDIDIFKNEFKEVSKYNDKVYRDNVFYSADLRNKGADESEFILVNNNFGNKLEAENTGRMYQPREMELLQGWYYQTPAKMEHNQLHEIIDEKILEKYNDKVDYSNTYFSIGTNPKALLDMSEGNNFILTDIDSHAMYINDYDSLFTQKYNPEVRIQDDHLYMEKYSDSILIMQHMSLLIDKDSKKTNLVSSGEIISKGDEVINFNNDAVRVYVDKGSRKVNVIDTIIQIDYTQKQIHYGDTYLFGHKDNYKISEKESTYSLDKLVQELNDTSHYLTLDKKSQKLIDDSGQVFLDHASAKPIGLHDNVRADLYSRPVELDYETFPVHKENYKIETSNLFDFKMFDKAPHGLFEDGGLGIDKYGHPIKFEDSSIVSFDKMPRETRFDDTDIGIQVGGKPLMDFQESFLGVDKMPKGIRFEKNLSVDKESIGVADLDGYFMISRNSNGIYNSDTLRVDKMRKDAVLEYDYTWITKGMKDSHMFYEQMFLDKSRKDSHMFYEQMFTSKKMKDGHLDYYILHIERDPKAIRTNDDLFAANLGRAIGIEKETFAYYQSKPIDLFKDVRAIEEGRKTDLTNSGMFGSWLGAKGIVNDEIVWVEYERLADYYKSFMVHRTIYQMRIADSQKTFKAERNMGGASITKKELLFRKEMHDTRLFFQSNFIFFGGGKPIPYDPDLKDDGRIDELLLPHKDYKYSDFLAKLLNPDGSINFAYVKSVDPVTGTYTVNIPVENPIDIYADIGRDYLDLNVYVVNLVVYLLRDIWKHNMFKYVAMSAQDSLREMLVELDKRLTEKFAEEPEYMDDAARCIQLFRWYCEMAILNNCEYELDFDTTKIAIDYYNKSLGDFANIIKFNNMEITDNYIIEPIDYSSEYGLEFTKDPASPSPVPYKLSFKLYNINTSSSISNIDDTGTVTVTDYPVGIHDIQIDLANKAILNSVPTKDNQAINVANIAVDNKTLRGFSVKYKGVFGEVNPIMQELLDHLLIFGTVSTTMKEKLKNVSAVSVAVDTIRKYFELHHQDKLKGKRLITKK
jgi:hypothetical protein